MNFNKEDLNSIRSKVDILEFMEARGNSFRQTGAAWVGLCPVHSERTPSFNIKPFNQTFRCYGCGINGDIFSLVQEIENLSFPGAVQYLADITGVKLSVEEDPAYKKRQRLQTVTRLTAEWFRYNYKKLDDSHPAKQNLAARNLLEFSLLDETVGFAPSGGALYRLLKEKQFTDDELVEAGVFFRTDDGALRERFRNRLTWAICTPQGQPVGFSARKLFESDNGPKYTNSPQTEIFNKSKNLLGIQDARREITQTQQVYIVEGQTDVMALRASGKNGVVASCGTAFGSEHANMLMHLSKMGKHTEQFKMIFCFDGDAAGVKAAKSVFESIPQIHLNAYVVKFEDQTDPCDYRKDYGDLRLSEFVDSKQVPLIEFVLSETRHNWNLETPEGKSNYVKEARKLLTHITDKIQYSAYVRKVAAWTGLSYTDLHSEMHMNQPTTSDKVDTENKYAGLDTLQPENLPVLAALVQHPEESLQVIENLGIDSSYFGVDASHIDSYIYKAQTKEIDYNDQVYLQLSHYMLNVNYDRVENSIESIFRSYLRKQFLIESAKLDSSLFDPGIDPVLAFQKIVEEQDNLKKRFRQ